MRAPFPSHDQWEELCLLEGDLKKELGHYHPTQNIAFL